MNYISFCVERRDYNNGQTYYDCIKYQEDKIKGAYQRIQHPVKKNQSFVSLWSYMSSKFKWDVFEYNKLVASNALLKTIDGIFNCSTLYPAR